MVSISTTDDELTFQGFTFQELLTPAGLERLDLAFLADLVQLDESLHAKLLNYRAGSITSARLVSQTVLEIAPILEAFIAKLFDIQAEVNAGQARLKALDPLFEFKTFYVLREAKRHLKKASEFADFAELDQWLEKQLQQQSIKNKDRELAVAHFARMIRQSPDKYQAENDQLIAWCVQALLSEAGRKATQHWVSFWLPKKLDYTNLVGVETVLREALECLQVHPKRWRFRDGFELTDPGMSQRQVQSEVHYCVYCHKNEGDFCSKGFPVKKHDPAQGLKRNPLKEILTGCPLEEKISEMHWLRKLGFNIGALATIMLDNPMCPATGHRICNDCMKSCIFQKQDPVNIPQVETGVLTDVLKLPWGVEIYDLLTRWNPLRREQWVAQKYNGKKVLVMGMGPAGFTLAHHLLMEGCAVVGAEGLKLEPLPSDYLNKPIKYYANIKEDLDDRVIAGFGGVAEYGITVRWDKNFLKLIYISLARRPCFQAFGSVRFGGTLTVEDVWRLGFDHLAVAVGAGLPRELSIPNSLAAGMRQANDFLMTLQLTGVTQASTIANLQIRLPAVVIGGGLTSIDTATEVQAYYLAQIERTYHRYSELASFMGEENLRARFDQHDLSTLDQFLSHAIELKKERALAETDKRKPNLIGLLRAWGGVTLIYRRNLQDSPAYRRNHEEVSKAFEEGIFFAEGLDPEAVLLDAAGSVSGLKCKQYSIKDGVSIAKKVNYTLRAKSILVATGAKPNIAYEYEHRGTFLRDGNNYRCFSLNGQPVSFTENCKAQSFGPFTSYEHGDRRVSVLGDTHPVFHGSVVKAIASAKRTYPAIVASLNCQLAAGSSKEYQNFQQKMSNLFQATVHSVTRHSEQLVELVVRAPLAAHNFRAGQFYRVQNYQTDALKIHGTLLQTEALAMLGAKSEKEADLIAFWVMERGASSRLVATFKRGQPLSVMGPTGVRSTIPTQPETVMVVGGLLAIAQLRALAPALRQAKHKIVFVACMSGECTQHCREQAEKHSDLILWVNVCDEFNALKRPQDRVASGQPEQVLRNLAMEQSTGDPSFDLKAVDRVIVVGSADLVQRWQSARRGVLRDCFRSDTKFFGSVYGAMMCMLKGVCAQCLQWQIDPKTGKRSKAVYACSWQEQPMELIETKNLEQRLSQNTVQEILSNCWLDYLFAKYDIIRV